MNTPVDKFTSGRLASPLLQQVAEPCRSHVPAALFAVSCTSVDELLDATPCGSPTYDDAGDDAPNMDLS